MCCRPTPGGGPGTLTVIDNRTGKRYEIAVGDHGTIRATDLKQIRAGGDGVGLRPYDNGCAPQGVRAWAQGSSGAPAGALRADAAGARCCAPACPLPGASGCRVLTPTRPLARPCSYVNTTACVSRVSFIDGDKGILRYRGYPIEQLAESSSFLEVRRRRGGGGAAAGVAGLCMHGSGRQAGACSAA